MGFGQKLCSKKFDAQKIRYICREPPRNPSAVVAFLLYVLFLLSSLIKPGKLEAELAARVKFFLKKNLKKIGEITHYETPREEGFALL